MATKIDRPTIPGPTLVRASEVSPDGTIVVLDLHSFRARMIILRKQA